MDEQHMPRGRSISTGKSEVLQLNGFQPSASAQSTLFDVLFANRITRGPSWQRYIQAILGATKTDPGANGRCTDCILGELG